MEKKSLSFLAQIKSKYILKEVLCFAYGEMKSVLKLVKYNKNLLNKLDINIKENYNYKIETKIEKKNSISYIFFLSEIIYFILFLAYIIKFYVSGKFNEENLKDGYNKKKKRFIDFMDNYILLGYFGFTIVSMIFIIIFFFTKCFVLKKNTKLIILLLINFVDLVHYISYIVKTAFSFKLTKEKKEESKENDRWFLALDVVIIIFLGMLILCCFMFLLIIIIEERCPTFPRNSAYETYDDSFIKDDIKKIFINQFRGINISLFELPDRFDSLNEKEKNEIIFKKENTENYKYESNFNKIDLISNKINDIRRKKNIHLLNYDKVEYLPDFIINEKTKMNFYPNENIYKLSPNFYIFKYLKDEFKNHINNNEVMNIILNEFLNKIRIIEKNKFEYISIYSNNPNINIQRSYNNIDIEIPNIVTKGSKIQLNINNNIDISNSEDKINDISKHLFVTEINDKEDYKEDDEIGSNLNIKTIKINKSVFQEK